MMVVPQSTAGRAGDTGPVSAAAEDDLDAIAAYSVKHWGMARAEREVAHQPCVPSGAASASGSATSIEASLGPASRAPVSTNASVGAEPSVVTAASSTGGQLTLFCGYGPL
jgi:hypothetical protein